MNLQKAPDLILDCLCNVPCTVTLYSDELDKNGSRIKTEPKQLKCFYQEAVMQRVDENNVRVKISGEAYFKGDIAPEMNVVSGGKMEIRGKIREISSEKGVQRFYNPEGTVNYTLVTLV